MGLTESSEVSSATNNGDGTSKARDRGCFGLMEADTTTPTKSRHIHDEPRARFRGSDDDEDDDDDADGPLRDDTAYASSSDDDEQVETFSGRIRAPPSYGHHRRPRHGAHGGGNASDSEEEAAEADRARREAVLLRTEAARQAAEHAASEAKAAERRRIRAAQRNGTFDVATSSPPVSPTPPSSTAALSIAPSTAFAVVAASARANSSPGSSPHGTPPRLDSPRIELKHSLTETHPVVASHNNNNPNGHRKKKSSRTTTSSTSSVTPTPSAPSPPASPTPKSAVASSSPPPVVRAASPPPLPSLASSPGVSTRSLLPSSAPLPPPSNRPAIGSMRKLGNTGEQKSCWSTTDASSFKIRLGPNYSKTSTKAPSLDALYDCIGCDVFKGRQSNLGARMELPPSPGITGPVTLPGVLLINCQLPSAFDVSVVFYFIVSASTRTLLADWQVLCARRLASAGGTSFDMTSVSPAVRNAALTPDTTPSYPPTIDCQMNALYHFERYINNTQPGIRRKLKGIVRIANVSEVKLGFIERPLVNSNNGTPFLLTESPSFHQGPNYFEVDIDINKFSMLARNGMEGFQDRINTMVLDYAFTVEGTADSELPERLLTCVRLYRPDLSASRTLPA